MKLKGSVTVFAMILLGLIIGMYLFGFTSPLFQYANTEILGQEGGLSESEYTAGDLLKHITDTMFSGTGFAIMGISIVGAVVTGLAGVGYIGQSILNISIPAFLLTMIANIMFFPVMSTSEAEGLPTEISLLLFIVFNVLLILTMISFIMGRD